MQNEELRSYNPAPDMTPGAAALRAPDESRDLTRRDLLARTASGGVAVAGVSLLAACGGSSSHSSTSATAASSQATTAFAGHAGTPPSPSRGGTLRIAMTGNGTSETYNPYQVSTPIDGLHVSSVFDAMIRPAPYVGREAGLVERWTPNKDATVWELQLRSGVTWHDGKPLTADDLIYSFRQTGGPTSLGGYAVANVRLKDIKKLGPLTVSVPLDLPIADLPGLFVYVNSAFVVQDGTKSYSKPVGTGPYELVSFVPGQRSVLKANRNYWDSPRPYPDQLEILSIDDPTARINALTGGEIDICADLPFVQAKANLSSSSYRVIVGEPGVSYLFYMRCDAAPFKDVRVRQAMKLIPDRAQLIEEAMSGFGAPGRDLECVGAKYFNNSLPAPTQDIEQAKSLLKAAGQSDLRLTLHTSEVLPGFTAAALAFAQQATAAGVTIKVVTEQPSQYFNPQILYLKESFAQDAWPGPSLVNNYPQQFLSTGTVNETHYYSKEFDRMYYAAQAATDPAQAQSLWNQVQETQYHDGGAIVWAYWRSTDAASTAVRGFGSPGSGWFTGTDDYRVWNWGLAS